MRKEIEKSVLYSWKSNRVFMIKETKVCAHDYKKIKRSVHD